MLGTFEGTADEKLDLVAGVFADLAPQAVCQFSSDGTQIVCTARRHDGEVHVERLRLHHLPAEVVRHAAMRLGKATHPAESIGEWERWASAWQVIQTYGKGALNHAAEQIATLTADGSPSGVEVWMDIGRRVVVLQATPEAWAGRG